MRSIVAAVFACLVCGLTSVAGEIDGSKLIGAWELTKVEGQEDAPHWRIEFLKDGKLRMTSKRDDKEFKVQGTYVLKKDNLTLIAKMDGKELDTQSFTVQKLTDELLIFLDSRVNKKMEFKRGK